MQCVLRSVENERVLISKNLQDTCEEVELLRKKLDDELQNTILLKELKEKNDSLLISANEEIEELRQCKIKLQNEQEFFDKVRILNCKEIQDLKDELYLLKNCDAFKQYHSLVQKLEETTESLSVLEKKHQYVVQSLADLQEMFEVNAKRLRDEEQANTEKKIQLEQLKFKWEQSVQRKTQIEEKMEMQKKAQDDALKSAYGIGYSFRSF